MKTLFESSIKGIKLEIIGDARTWFLIVRSIKSDCLKGYFKFKSLKEATDFAYSKHGISLWKSYVSDGAILWNRKDV